MKYTTNTHIAYFSMEIGFNDAIPTYSGGLGVLAGDSLRSCADLEVPVVGMTLFYKKGFFRQKIDNDGNQHEEEEILDAKLFSPVPNITSVRIEGRDVKIKAWVYMLKGISGFEVPIIFLDTDIPENSEYDRSITQKLYAYDQRFRLCQETVLGMGGVRMLKSLGYSIHKYHMNEGHSALLTIELSKGMPLEDVRKACVFTTHTPVAAGHDEFPRGLVEQLINDELPKKRDFYQDDKLNMTHLGLIYSNYINGVAKKHGEVSRNMFPGYHIESITNGVHSAFWTAKPMKKLFDKYLPGWECDPFSLRYVLSIQKDEIWDAHLEAKKELIEFVNAKCDAGMDANTFTIGFARRAATYKRGDLLFTDIDRLMRIAQDSKGLQIIYAGKAHPNDWEGKQVIKRIIERMRAVRSKIKVCYVENYEMSSAKLLVSGVDLWLNTPMRPKEASGTSGMKAAHNGVPHFSVLDGWWLEGHIENITGWSIGAHPDKCPECVHEEDIEDMYTKLEYIILPRFYQERDTWIETMRHSIAINGSFFNTHRMVHQYVLNAYFS